MVENPKRNDKKNIYCIKEMATKTHILSFKLMFWVQLECNEKYKEKHHSKLTIWKQ
jgi:hypothetical protein